MAIEIRLQAFDPWQSLAEYQASSGLKTGSYGATAVFVGTMRDLNEGDIVSAMTLEHYPGMTDAQLHKLATETISSFDLLDALIVHRVGHIEPDQTIVLVAAWSAHRKAAFDGCREIMETLKSKAPFWKKEILADSERWVEKNTPG